MFWPSKLSKLSEPSKLLKLLKKTNKKNEVTMPSPSTDQKMDSTSTIRPYMVAIVLNGAHSPENGSLQGEFAEILGVNLFQALAQFLGSFLIVEPRLLLVDVQDVVGHIYGRLTTKG